MRKGAQSVIRHPFISSGDRDLMEKAATDPDRVFLPKQPRTIAATNRLVQKGCFDMHPWRKGAYRLTDYGLSRLHMTWKTTRSQ